MSIARHTDRNGLFVYTNTRTGRVARVSGDDLESIKETCLAWHGDDNTATRNFIQGDASYRNLCAILAALRSAQDIADNGELAIDNDDYLDLAMSIEDLEGIVRRIEALGPTT